MVLFKLTIRTTLLLLIALLASVNYASAQGFSAYFGLGTATDSPGTSRNVPALGGLSCPPGQIFDDINGACERAPSMGGVFGVFGADFMIKPHLGVNGEYAFRFAQANYLPLAGIKDRPAFYDFNAVYQPLSVGRRIVPVIEGGLGGAKVSLYFSQTGCVTSICQTQSVRFASANHFQLHAAVGVKLYVKGNIFIKPQFDFHWVHNLNQQFGRNTVPQYTVAVGYSFGEH
jgi:hypothetical protein